MQVFADHVALLTDDGTCVVVGHHVPQCAEHGNWRLAGDLGERGLVIQNPNSFQPIAGHVCRHCRSTLQEGSHWPCDLDQFPTHVRPGQPDASTRNDVGQRYPVGHVGRRERVKYTAHKHRGHAGKHSVQCLGQRLLGAALPDFVRAKAQCLRDGVEQIHQVFSKGQTLQARE